MRYIYKYLYLNKFEGFGDEKDPNRIVFHQPINENHLIICPKWKNKKMILFKLFNNSVMTSQTDDTSALVH